MKKIILLLILIAVPFIVSAQTTKKKAVYFYTETCPHCVRVSEYFQNNGIYEKYDIKKIEASGAENYAILNRYFDAFGSASEKRGYPVIFFADQMLVGDQPIIGNFVNEIEKVGATEFPTPESIKAAREESKNLPDNGQKNTSMIPIPLLIGAALADALNPCALAVLILLLATVMAAKGKNKALLSGLAFSFAIFTSYMMMGLGLYTAITAFSLPHYFSLVVAILAIAIGLANLKDVIWYGKVFIMEVPRNWRPKMQAILKKVTGPLGALGAGYLVSLFLVPCASGPYIVLLGKLAEKVSVTKTVPLLTLYNLVFVLPMIIITLAMYFGSARMGKLEEWRKNNLRLLHAITAGLMLFIGGYLLYYL